MKNIKPFKLFLIKESNEIEDAVEMVFADLADKYVTNIDIIDKDEVERNRGKLATISFSVNSNPHNAEFYVEGSFYTEEFLERINQLKDYLGNTVRFLYSYKSRTTRQDYIKTFPAKKYVNWLKIFILEN